MKVLLCASCMDIRALGPNGEPTTCRCGTVTAWWLSPIRGTVKVFAHDDGHRFAWVIGMHNGFLRTGVQMIGMSDSEVWRDLHERICEKHSDGYLFHKDKRNCWAAPVRPGWSSDISWATQEELNEQYHLQDSGSLDAFIEDSRLQADERVKNRLQPKDDGDGRG